MLRDIARVTAIFIAIVVCLGLAYRFLPAIGPVSPAALQYSLAGETGGLQLAVDPEPCRRRAPRRWRCWVETAEGSGAGNHFRLVRDGRRCWRARRIGRSEGWPDLPPRAAGCVGVRDQIRIWHRI